jgi:predicted dehydrogenase
MPNSPKRLKVAVTGAGLKNSPDGREGWAARAHVPALKKLSDLYDVVAVCTTHLDTAQNAARHFDVPHAFDNVDHMLEALPEIDVVCVSVRPVHHYKVVSAALRAGKHVYCEQPLGVSTAEARAMTVLAKQAGVRTVIGHQSHYEPATLHMAELVREGYIGRPLSFNHTYFVGNYIVPRPSHRQWLFDADMGGHPGYRSGHSLDRVHSVLGRDITSICADMAVQVPERIAVDTGGIIRSNQVDSMNYLLRMDGKAGATIMGTMQTSFAAWFGSGNRFEIYGTEGMLMLATGETPDWDKQSGEGDPSRGELKLYGAQANIRQYVANPTPPERLQNQYREITIPKKHFYVQGMDRGRGAYLVAQTWHAFAKAINMKHECAPSFRDKLKIHRVWDAAEASVDKRGWVNVDYSGIS